MEKLIGSF
jgi:hypothetical protein